MKKLAIGLVAATLVLNIGHLETTFSFLTSEKKQQSPISTGTNEDVFVTDVEELVVTTEVTKHKTVVRKRSASGTTSQSSHTTITIDEGVARITFTPKREHLVLGLENVTVTGIAEDEVKVELIEPTEGEKEEGFQFRITHNRQKVGQKSQTEKGELQVTALGGFYTKKIPLTIRTSYSTTTDIEEETEPDQPNQPNQPGQPDQPSTPETPAPGGGSSETSPPPPTDGGSPTTPPTDSSGPAPPTPEEPEEDAPPPDSPSTETPSSPGDDVGEAGGDSQPVDLAK
ncbi:hypothetical protein [Brevibacillus sp. 179-C 1.1 NHS]|uniref:hypothetical protein n=1 Tax=Brevibacillus sp. 179-C 1.1 NHS TaxID=3235177 RepID=UPI0039A0DE12